jgi:diacylglycerol kinase family enzyme
MRVLLLVNATASSVTARKRVMIRKLLSAEHDVELAETTRRGHATRLAHAAANDGFDVVAVLAGDGTLNEAADGLLHTATALAPLPGGSTNVYARTLGYPNDSVAAAQLLLASLAADATKRIGVGLANRRPFLFNTGIGFDAAVIRRVERYGELKRYASHPRSKRSSARKEPMTGSRSNSTPARRSTMRGSSSSRRPTRTRTSVVSR